MRLLVPTLSRHSHSLFYQNLPSYSHSLPPHRRLTLRPVPVGSLHSPDRGPTGPGRGRFYRDLTARPADPTRPRDLSEARPAAGHSSGRFCCVPGRASVGLGRAIGACVLSSRRSTLTSVSVLGAEAARWSNRASRHGAQSKFNLNLASQLRLLLANNDTGLHSSRSALTHVNDTKCGGNGSNSSAAEGGPVGGASARAVRCGSSRTASCVG